jgi:excisionase family DNA binding protein
MIHRKDAAKEFIKIMDDIDSPWMDVDQCAKYLGLSRETIYRHIYSGKIPVNRIGKLYRFHREEIDIWICSDGEL